MPSTTRLIPTVKRVVELIDPSARKIILEAGCVLGENELYIAAPGHAVFGAESASFNRHTSIPTRMHLTTSRDKKVFSAQGIKNIRPSKAEITSQNSWIK